MLIPLGLLIGYAMAAMRACSFTFSTRLDSSPDSFAALAGDYFIYFMRGCDGGCRELASKWDAAAAKAGYHGSMVWAHVDCIVNRNLCDAEDINAVPALRVYRNGRHIYDYTTTQPSVADLWTFGLELAKRGDAALSVEYEKATPLLLLDVELARALAGLGHYSKRVKETFAAAGRVSTFILARIRRMLQRSGRGVAVDIRELPGHGADSPMTSSTNPGHLSCAELNSECTCPNNSDSNVPGYMRLNISALSRVYLECKECGFLKQIYAAGESLTYDWGVVDCERFPALC